jgi:site-specific DNA recombinase
VTHQDGSLMSTTDTSATPVVRASLRVSTGRQAEEGHSLDQQEHRAAEYAAREGRPLVVYREEGVSGASKRRPERDRLLADLRRGDVVLVTSLDRLGRSTRDLLEVFESIEAKGATLVSLRESIDTSSAAGRLLRTILAGVAEFEREIGRERTSSGIAGRGRTTGKPWGSLPYGLRRDADGDTEWDPVERPVVERIYAMRQAGMSKSGIARDLTSDGVPTRNGAKLWAPIVVSKILRGREPLGEVYVGGEWRSAKHEPILDAAAWDAVQALDEQSRKYAPGGRSGRTSDRHLFQRGLLRCVCGAAMLPRTAKDQQAFYVCRHRARDASSCSTPRLRASEVDGRAFEMFNVVSHDLEATRRHLVEQIDARAAETRSLAVRAERDVADLAVQAERVEGDYRRGALPAEDYAHLRSTIAEERRAAVEQAARLASRVEEVEAMRASVDAEDESLRRLAALRESISRRMTATADLDALRAAMVGVFETVVLVPHPEGFNLKPLFRPDVEVLRAGIGFTMGSDKLSESGVPLYPAGWGVDAASMGARPVSGRPAPRRRR